MSNPSIEHPVSKISEILSKIIEKMGKTDIDSQIELMELLNDEFMVNPTFIAIIQSLKELRAIKRNQNK